MLKQNLLDEEFDLVCSLFSSSGKTVSIALDKMKEIIAINSSSPAFIYLFAKGFIDYAKKVNINEDIAKALFAQTLIGSAKMIAESGYSIDELIKMVSHLRHKHLEGLMNYMQAILLKWWARRVRAVQIVLMNFQKPLRLNRTSIAYPLLLNQCKG